VPREIRAAGSNDDDDDELRPQASPGCSRKRAVIGRALSASPDAVEVETDVFKS
jgi:hypothetical protein